MPSGLTAFETFLEGWLVGFIAKNLTLETLIKQMSFGLIDVIPPEGSPSLTSQLNYVVYRTTVLEAQLTALTTLCTNIGTKADEIYTIVEGLGGPVTLPSTPPAGYGVDDGSIAGAVWAYDVGGYTQAAGDLLLDAGMMAISLSSVRARFPSGKSKYFEIGGTWYSTAGADTDRDYPMFPVANILSTDTLDVFLERESGFNGWIACGDGTWQVRQDDPANDFIIHTKITDAEFLVLRDGAALESVVAVPPVWPGLVNVTVGDPVDLARGNTITEAMDGVIIHITGAPTKQGYFTFDDLLSYRNIGALTFIDDNGDAEYPQGLGFTSAVYCPKSMKRAAGVKVRTAVDVVGTVTPWITTVP